MYKFCLLLLFWPVWLLVLLVVLLLGFWLLSFTLLMAHVGYLHFLSAWKRCFSSSCNNCGLERTVVALWYRVPATLYLDGMVWWLSHCGYRSVWVGFLNTDVFKLPSSSGVIRISYWDVLSLDAVGSCFLVFFLDDCECVFHKSLPQGGRCC